MNFVVFTEMLVLETPGLSIIKQIENFWSKTHFQSLQRKILARSHQLVLHKSDVWPSIKYLNAGQGLPWAGHVRDIGWDPGTKICSIATEENFGAEPPIGSRNHKVLDLVLGVVHLLCHTGWGRGQPKYKILWQGGGLGYAEMNSAQKYQRAKEKLNYDIIWQREGGGLKGPK